MDIVLVVLGVIFAWFALSAIIVLIFSFFHGFFSENKIAKPYKVVDYLADRAEAAGKKLGKKVNRRG